MFDLRRQTPPEWLDAVFADFEAFLLDHAACERKASATGMSFVVRYPDRSALIEPMIEFAREELEHFHIMYKLVAERGLILCDDYKDPYVNALRAQCRSSGDALLLDRLVVSGIVEARGCVVSCVAALVERHESAGRALRGRGYPVYRIFYTDEHGNLYIDEDFVALAEASAPALTR